MLAAADVGAVGRDKMREVLGPGRDVAAGILRVAGCAGPRLFRLLAAALLVPRDLFREVLAHLRPA
jgi:hypothetical protein